MEKLLGDLTAGINCFDERTAVGACGVRNGNFGARRNPALMTRALRWVYILRIEEKFVTVFTMNLVRGVTTIGIYC